MNGVARDQGLNFTIEPNSLAGALDLIAEGTVVNAKIFDGDNRGKSYLIKGFGQAYDDVQKCKEPVGCLVIDKLCQRNLEFSVNLPDD